MDPSLRVVMQMPLTELWDDAGLVTDVKLRHLSRNDVAAMLRQGRVRFVVANSGEGLKWSPPSECYDFWKTEVKSRIAETGRVFLEEFPNEYCYVASEWTDNQQSPIVLLEKHH